ncbi:MAG: 3'-5' exonuclease domain-containing protein 2 [Marinilabiliaceae bacterium]|nr:3'-5' exonuclease domain-containing protein 2 [Marinilabiliaceae bacterium]
MKRRKRKVTVIEPPIVKYKGNILLIEKDDEVEGIVDNLLKCEVLGFDTETKPSFTKGVRNNIALLQLYSETGAFLFRLNKIGFHPALIRLLEEESILKIGVAIRDDLRGLNKFQQFNPAGFIDLQTLAPQYQLNSLSLKGLAAEVLDQRISKRQQTSNWEAQNLTNAQIVYAATDAWVSLNIYKKLVSG